MIDLAPSHKRGFMLEHPVMNASGILGFAHEYRGLIDFARLGAFVTNALTWHSRTSARPPNVIELPTGVIIHTGLPNPGVRVAVRKYARDWARLGCPVIVHLAATTPADVARSVEVLERVDAVSGIELGVRDDVTASELNHLIRAARGGPPLLARLPLSRASELSGHAVQAGVSALTIAAPPRIASPDSDGESHGRWYSPEVFAVALDAVRAVANQNLGVPLIGAGGIFSAENALAMLDVGAIAVQWDAALWRNPTRF